MFSENRVPFTERFGFGNKKLQLLKTYDSVVEQLRGIQDHSLITTGDVNHFTYILTEKGNPKIYLPEPHLNLLSTYFLWNDLSSSFLENISNDIILKGFNLSFRGKEIHITDIGLKEWPYIKYLGAKFAL